MVRALVPVAAIIASWSPADRALEHSLWAVSDRDTAAAAVLEDFYIERDFFNRASRALKKAGIRWGFTRLEAVFAFMAQAIREDLDEQGTAAA